MTPVICHRSIIEPTLRLNQCQASQAMFGKCGFHADALLNVLRMNMKPRHPSDDDVEAYSMGKLAYSSLQEFETHLFVCEHCRLRVVEIDQFLKLLNELSPQWRSPINSASADGLFHFKDQRDRRSESRIECSRMAAIHPLCYESNRAQTSLVGLLVDQSASGAGIYLHVPMALGSLVEIRTASKGLHGLVKFCKAMKDKYRIGVELAHLH